MSDNFKKLALQLNNIFKDFDNDVKLFISKTKKTRNSKISFSDVLYYKCLYTFKDETKETIVSSFNNDYYLKNNINLEPIDRTTFYKKSLEINLTIYKNLYNKIKKLFDVSYKSNNSDYLIAVDGTYNNTNIKNIKNNLETNLNLGFFSINDCISLDITHCGENNKNQEISQLQKYINDHKLENNMILVLDRAYYSYDLINFLDTNKINYIIRIKNNSKLINKDTIIKTDPILKNNNNNKKINNKFRVVSYKTEVEKEVNVKNNTYAKILKTINCNLVTNLDDSYTDDKIKDFYKSRWDIEVFFKFLKYNFRFSRLDEHHKEITKEEYEKHYYLILIINFIRSMIEKVSIEYYKLEQKLNTKLKLESKVNSKIEPKALLDLPSKMASQSDTTKLFEPKTKSKMDSETKYKKKLKTKSKTKIESNTESSNKHDYYYKINKSTIVKGMKKILYKIVKSTIVEDDLILFSKSYVKIKNIIINRSNPRKSKQPFSKWYVKGYSETHVNRKVVTYLINEKNNVKNNINVNKNIKLIINETKLISDVYEKPLNTNAKSRKNTKLNQ